MSDPRIYHRVSPVAPEGRQIYDDMRRRNLSLTANFDSELSTVNTLLNADITAINTDITAIETAATELDTQVNALTITPVQVGTGTGFALHTGISNALPSSLNSENVSEIEVTPVVAGPFFLDILGGLLLEASSDTNNFYANIYEITYINPPFKTYTWLQNLYVGTETTPVPVRSQGWTLPSSVDAGQGGAPIGLSAHILIPNTSTDAREFEFFVRSEDGTGTRIAQHTGSFNAFQWTVA